jgi:hypothetical protein
LRSRWYQVKSRAGGLLVVSSFAKQRWQALEGPPNRRGEVPTRAFNNERTSDVPESSKGITPF